MHILYRGRKTPKQSFTNLIFLFYLTRATNKPKVMKNSLTGTLYIYEKI